MLSSGITFSWVVDVEVEVVLLPVEQEVVIVLVEVLEDDEVVE
ncbi:MAG: hypothetical protein OK474_01405 [Thaumarchaeota archaeon]|nr:hypothetical protein [Nitrososphaerota archaeon]